MTAKLTKYTHTHTVFFYWGAE